MPNWLQILLVLAITIGSMTVVWLIIGDNSVLRAGSLFVIGGTAAFVGHLLRKRRKA